MRVIIAAGRTGGHLLPGVAVAERILELEPQANILFVCSKGGLAGKILKTSKLKFQLIDLNGIRCVAARRMIKNLISLGAGLIKARRIIKKFMPDVVLGMGGIVSLPLVLNAALIGKRTAIHEQNIILGTTNRFLSHFVDRIFLSFPHSEGYLLSKKGLFTGNPVRSQFLVSNEEKNKRGAEDYRLKILILGGSQGARFLNELIVESIDELSRYAQRIALIHISGEDDFLWVEEAYRESNLQAGVLPFSFEMAGLLRWCDLVISRAGATTLSEVCVCGKPAIAIPFPYAVRDHQMQNGLFFSERGALILKTQREMDSEGLLGLIEKAVDNRSWLKGIGQRALEYAHPDAGDKVAREIIRMVQ